MMMMMMMHNISTTTITTLTTIDGTLSSSPFVVQSFLRFFFRPIDETRVGFRVQAEIEDPRGERGGDEIRRFPAFSDAFLSLFRRRFPEQDPVSPRLCSLREVPSSSFRLRSVIIIRIPRRMKPFGRKKELCVFGRRRRRRIQKRRLLKTTTEKKRHSPRSRRRQSRRHSFSIQQQQHAMMMMMMKQGFLTSSVFVSLYYL